MWAVIKKELKSYFTTPIGYIFIGIFLLAFSVSFYFTVLGYGNVKTLFKRLNMAGITKNMIIKELEEK